MQIEKIKRSEPTNSGNKYEPITPETKKARSINGVKIFTRDDINDVLTYAATLERARAPIHIHEKFEEVPQRFINCLVTDSYVRPHMHVVPNQWELMCWLSGEIIVLLFDDKGKVTSRITMNETEGRVIEIPPFHYHTYIAVKDCAYLEVRNCKYQPTVDRIYSAWSPEENTLLAEKYVKRLLHAKVGDNLIC
jgi:cupin fold WbuC family metalloprotein